MHSTTVGHRPAISSADVTRVIRETLLVEVASADDDLLASGTLDSLTLMELLAQLESQFGLKFSLAELDIDDLRSVNTITHWCNAVLGAAPELAVAHAPSGRTHIRS